MIKKKKKAFTLIELLIVMVIIAFTLSIMFKNIIEPLVGNEYKSYLNENFKKIENSMNAMMYYSNNTFQCIDKAKKGNPGVNEIMLDENDPDYVKTLNINTTKLTEYRNCINDTAGGGANLPFPEIISNFTTRDYSGRPIRMEVKYYGGGQPGSQSAMSECMMENSNKLEECITYAEVTLIGVGADGDPSSDGDNYRYTFNTYNSALNAYMGYVEDIEKCSNIMTNSFYTQYLQNGRTLQNYFINPIFGFIQGASGGADYVEFSSGATITSFQDRKFSEAKGLVTDSYFDCFNNKGNVGYFSNLNDPDLSYSGIGLYPVFTRPNGKKVFAYFVYSGRYL